MYVDETKAKGYVLAAAVVLPSDVTAIRKTVRALIAPGQPRLHMKAEKTPHQRAILSALVPLDLTVTLYEADARTHRTDIARRRACLAQLVHDQAGLCEHLVLESDTTQDARDRQALIDLTRAAGCRDTMTYEHATATSGPLLSIPDAIAWAWARGGDWRRRVQPVVERVVPVQPNPDMRKARAPRPRRVTSLRLPRGSAPRAPTSLGCAYARRQTPTRPARPRAVPRANVPTARRSSTTGQEPEDRCLRALCEVGDAGRRQP